MNANRATVLTGQSINATAYVCDSSGSFRWRISEKAATAHTERRCQRHTRTIIIIGTMAYCRHSPLQCVFVQWRNRDVCTRNAWDAIASALRKRRSLVNECSRILLSRTVNLSVQQALHCSCVPFKCKYHHNFSGYKSQVQDARLGLRGKSPR